MTISIVTMLPLLSKMGEYLKAGFEHYVMLRASGMEVTPDMLAVFIEAKMEGWEPQIKGIDLLDPETKTACARFMAGVAFNIGKSK